MSERQSTADLAEENRLLRNRLEELEETLHAIRSGEVDALVISGPAGEQVYSLRGALEPYRIMVETMSEGAVSLAQNGTIFYCNSRFAELVKTPQESIVAQPFYHWVSAQDWDKFDAMLAHGRKGIVREKLLLQTYDSTQVPVYLSMCPLPDSIGMGIAVVITDLTEFTQAEHKIKKQVKELRAFYYLSELAERDDLDSVLKDLADVLIESWQYSEIAGARIVMGEKEFQTDNFKSTPWMQTAPVKINGSIAGKIEIAYLEQKPEQDEGPFLKAERHLINAIAERVGHIAERKHTADELEKHRRHLEELVEERTKKVAQSEERFRRIFENAATGISITDLKGRFQQTNAAYCTMLGYREDELRQLDFAQLIHPDDRDANLEEIEHLKTGEKPYFEIENRYIHKDGHSIWVHKFVSLLPDDQGESKYILTLVTNITERKQADEALQQALTKAEEGDRLLSALMEYVPEGITIADKQDAKLRLVSRYGQELLGDSHTGMETADVVGRWPVYYADGITPMAYEDVPLMRALQHGATVTNVELVQINAEGRRLPLLCNAAPIQDKTGAIVGAIVVWRDISERKQAEEKFKRLNTELQQKAAELAEMNNELESFAYSVSHDLRTPLRAIDGFSSILLKHCEGKLDDEGQRFLNVIRENTTRMSQLIDDILAFSRMGRMGMVFSEIDMEDLAHTIFEDLRPSIGGRELTLEVKPLPPCRGDLAMLRQVWVNLLVNAIKFTRSKATALIEIGGYSEEAENIFYIRDNGAGFDMRYADKLFGVFQRLHGIDEFEGTGIGLAIVKRIITRHGGRVWAEGKINEGATFYFALPLRNEEA